MSGITKTKLDDAVIDLRHGHFDADQYTGQGRSQSMGLFPNLTFVCSGDIRNILPRWLLRSGTIDEWWFHILHAFCNEVLVTYAWMCSLYLFDEFKDGEKKALRTRQISLANHTLILRSNLLSARIDSGWTRSSRKYVKTWGQRASFFRRRTSPSMSCARSTKCWACSMRRRKGWCKARRPLRCFIRSDNGWLR